jgi:hypothetical protein
LYALGAGYGYLSDAGALALAGSPFLRCLTYLYLNAGKLSETGRRALEQATHGVWGRHGPEERAEPFFSWQA